MECVAELRMVSGPHNGYDTTDKENASIGGLMAYAMRYDCIRRTFSLPCFTFTENWNKGFLVRELEIAKLVLCWCVSCLAAREVGVLELPANAGLGREPSAKCYGAAPWHAWG
eukprot:3307515-Amphidinium_carterae.1